MITPAFARTMADYNAVMNNDLYGVASQLDDAERRRDRGAFWHSIHGTLCHLLWADTMWMSRFAGWQAPPVVLKDSAGWYDDFAEMTEARHKADAGIGLWADGLTDAKLTGDLTWYSGAAGREFTYPVAFLVAHFFNHQTHHRGQAHALLTAAGATPGATDIPMLIEPAA
ncbi:MAG: DinB family protein [Rhodospirillaceae bacterium]|nr:DinB family protein [Rhodospirillaceae bacterium]